MNCIIIDDEPMAIEVLERYIEKVSDLSNKGSFREPMEALSFLNEHSIDFILLDINMPGLSGIQFLQTLKHKPDVIFTTAYASYAAESYDLNAVDYLLKPITFDRFIKALNKIYSKRKVFSPSENNTNRFIILKSGTQLHRVKISEILFLEKEGNYFTVYTTKQKIMIRENMSEVFTILPSEGFIRVHKSFIIAIDKIDVIEQQQLSIGEHRIPIGQVYKDELLAYISKKQ